MKKAYRIEKKGSIIIFLAQILAWNNEIKESLNFGNQLLSDEKYKNNKIGSNLENYLQLLLAKNQQEFLYNYFHSEKAKAINLKEKLKPIYYATTYYLQDKYPLEYLRMGEELKETVEEIIQKVEQMRIDYA